MAKSVLKFFHSFLFLILYLTLFVIIAYPVLVLQGLFSYDLYIHQIAVSVFMSLGLFLITIAIIIHIIKSFKEKASPGIAKKILVSVLLIGCLIGGLYSYQYFNRLPNSAQTTQSFFKKINIMFMLTKNFYMGMFYDTFGYPADTRMTTADELLEAINNHRIRYGLQPINIKRDLCDMAQTEQKSSYPLIYTKNYQSVTEFGQGKKIIQVFEQPTLAENIINRYWWRPFSEQQKAITDSRWIYGCGFVSGLHLVFILTQ